MKTLTTLNALVALALTFIVTGCVMQTADAEDFDPATLDEATSLEESSLVCPRKDDGSCMKQQDGTECLLLAPLADIVTAANREGLENSRKKAPVGGKITLTGRVHYRDLVPQACHPDKDFVAMEDPQLAHIEVITVDPVDTVHLKAIVDNDAAKIKVYDKNMDLLTWQEASKCGEVKEYQDPGLAGWRICTFELPVAVYVVEFSAVADLQKPDDVAVDLSAEEAISYGSFAVYATYVQNEGTDPSDSDVDVEQVHSR